MKSISTARTVLGVFLFLFFPAILFAQPANNNCGGAVQLTSNTTCIKLTNQTLNGATDSAGYPIGCLAGTHYDVWYYFTAMATTETVTISSVGANINSPELQVLSGSCNAMTSIQCAAGNTVTASGLTIGGLYYVRVSNVGSNPSGTGNGPKFDICLTHPAPAVANDECTGAISLTSNSTCTNTLGTLINATASPGVPSGCASAGTHYDVWYSFVSVTPIETITFTKNNPSNISNPELQLFTGSCGSLTSIQCGTTSISATGLTVGTTYYVRVSQVGGTALTTKGDFNICVRHSDPTPSNIDFSKSYVNITKGNGGGTVSPGDTLEIRATLVLRSGASVDSLSLLDTLAAGEGMLAVPGSLALRTNEGKLYKSFSDAFDADAGWRTSSINNSADTVIQINFGVGASSSARGALSSTSKPSVFGSTCIIMATFRVVVTAAYGSTINLGGGELTMRNKSTGSYSDLIFPPRNVIVYQSPGLCPNAVSATNAIGGDVNGTFGAPSGTPPLTKNRGTSANVPSYIYAAFSTGAPQDYYYGITNNTGAGGASFTTTTTWPKPDPTSPTHRVFNVWDITGDHTGATNTAKGNPPCDTTKAISATNPCGYMLVINSAYKTDTAFTYGVTNLCPNTYYEISAWIKNICYKCSCDSNGIGASSGTAGYIPFAPNDSSGVQPNLAFDINGTDYYTTGNIAYAGVYPTTQAGSDSTNIWVKRGFTYLTGASQTSFTLTIRNNAPGGGGNDWALDDITLATCLPNMQYSPSLSPWTCQNNPGLVINDTVRSYFNNYSNYKWQKSTDGGTTWTDVTSAGSTTPTWNGSAYEYVTSYTIPQGSTTLADSGTKYRVVVATTSSNLSTSSCLFTDGISIITLNVYNNCGPVLDVNLLSFNGKMVNHNANLFWRTTREIEPISFTIERSVDGIHFSPVATFNGHGNSSDINYYSYTDPSAVSGTVFYRIAMMNNSGKIKYSQTISLSDQSMLFALVNAINPFNSEINFELAVPQDSRIEAVLTSVSGKPLKRQTFVVYEGVNSLTMSDMELLPKGMYILRLNFQGTIINKKLMKR